MIDKQAIIDKIGSFYDILHNYEMHIHEPEFYAEMVKEIAQLQNMNNSD